MDIASGNKRWQVLDANVPQLRTCVCTRSSMRAGSLELCMEHPRRWGGARAKKGPSEGEFFFFSCCSWSRRRVAEELSADGAPLAGDGLQAEY